MFGWSKWAATRASSTNMMRKPGSETKTGLMRLTATRRTTGGAVLARKTSAMPPTAIRRSTWYFPKTSGAPAMLPSMGAHPTWPNRGGQWPQGISPRGRAGGSPRG